MSTIRELMTNLSGARDVIKEKLVEMGLTVGSTGKLSDVALAADQIQVDKETTKLELSSGQTHVLKPGEYYANAVEIVADSAELDNQYYDGDAGYTENKSLAVRFSTQETASGNIYNIKDQTPATFTAPNGYIIDTVTTENLVIQATGVSTSSITAVATKSDDSKSCTISLSGGIQGKNLSSATAMVNLTVTYVAGSGYTGGTAVTPTTEDQDFYAADGKFMTAFSVAAIPIENKTASGDELVTRVAANGPESIDEDELKNREPYKVVATSGKYMTEVSIPTTVLIDLDVNGSDTFFDEYFNGSDDNYVINITEAQKTAIGAPVGFGSITLPRPEAIDVPDNVSIMDLGSDAHTLTLDTGFVAGATIAFDNADLYAALAAI